MERHRVSSGSPYEPVIGFSRAVRVGNRISVSGTAPIADDGSAFAPGDAYGQAKRCIELIRRAIRDLGADLEAVQRTRIYLTDSSVWRDVARAHGEAFGEIRPASTAVVVAGLLDPAWLVEMEAEALLDEAD